VSALIGQKNVVVIKHISVHASTEMANYVEKRTKVISKLMLFTKLTGGPFLQEHFF